VVIVMTLHLAATPRTPCRLPFSFCPTALLALRAHLTLLALDLPFVRAPSHFQLKDSLFTRRQQITTLT